MIKKRIFSYAMLLLVLFNIICILSGCSTSEKIPIPTVKENVYIYDEDNILDDEVESSLNQMLVELEEKTEAEFVVVSIESLLDHSIETYANNLFNTLGIGKKGKDNGVLLLISRSDKRVRLEIGRGLEGCLTDSKCGNILDNYFVPYRESDEYTKATDLTVQAVLKVVSKEYDITIDGLNAENLQVEEKSGLTGKQIIITIIIVLVIIIVLELITGHLGGDGFGDGIFLSGGSSGSGSSGGFGGGFSGGGGASR